MNFINLLKRTAVRRDSTLLLDACEGLALATMLILSLYLPSLL